MDFFTKLFENKPPQDKVPHIIQHMKSKSKGKKQLGQFLSSIRCNGQQKGAWQSVCVHIDCKQSAIICDKADCSCRINHKKCQKEKKRAETFVSKAIKKSKVRVNNQWLDSIKTEIAKLSAEIEEIYARLRLCFLDRNEGNFVFCLHSGNAAELQKLTGSQMHSVHSELEMPISKDGLKQKVKKVWSNMPLQKFEDMVANSLKIIESLQEKRQWFEKNKLQQIRIRREQEEAERVKKVTIAEVKVEISSSNVLSRVEEWRVLLGMFPQDRRPKGFKLLFRASDYGFDVKYKKKYCGVAHTVLLVKTEYGKVIGGYTPLKWKISKKQYGLQQQYNTSGESFVFSISNNHKLTHSSPTKNYAVAHDNEYGPWFWGVIWIFNKSNTENKSKSLNWSPLPYVHPKYKGFDKESRTKFDGSSDGYFHTQQWEVHQVVFEEQPEKQ